MIKGSSLNIVVEVGDEFGQLTVLAFAGYRGSEKNPRKCWECQCTCGNKKIVAQKELRNGDTISCGCHRSQLMKETKTTHGHTKDGKQSKKYRAHAHMVSRCENSNVERYKNYGGRGIRLCSHWRIIDNFLNEMSDCPQPENEYVIDRIDNDLMYSCGHCQDCSKNNWHMNCKWSTHEESMNNMSTNHIVEINGEKMTLSQAFEKYNIPKSTGYRRIGLGWTIEETVGFKQHPKYEHERDDNGRWCG